MTLLSTLGRRSPAWIVLALLVVLGPLPAFADADFARPQAKVRGLVVVEGPDGRFYGKALEIIGTVAPGNDGLQAGVLGRIGGQMQTALVEAVRLVRLRRPEAPSGVVQVSFDDKYTPKDGGSAGTAFTLLLLSTIDDDLELDPAFAVTGDITVDGKVRPVGGVSAKIRGAATDGAKVVGIPLENESSLGDMLILHSGRPLWDVQVIGLETIEDALALARQPREGKLAEAIALFEELRKKTGGRSALALRSRTYGQKMQEVLELAPNHLSAKWLLMRARGQAPRRLSVRASIGEAFSALGTLRHAFDHIPKPHFATKKATVAAHKDLMALKRTVDPATLPVIDALDEMIRAYAVWAVTESNSSVQAIREKFAARKAFTTKLTAVRGAVERVVTDPEVIERMLRGE